jgi:hypothetical protein
LQARDIQHTDPPTIMSKTLRIFLIVLGAILILGFIGLRVMTQQTKKFSPEEVVTLVKDDMKLEVKYCRPFKKGREIFGGLVPYGEVWRTGANEATTFTTDTEIELGGTRVQPGTYTLWTIPGPDEWKVILNDKRYGWGVSWGGVASREAENDVATATVPVGTTAVNVEQFTIHFTEEPLAMVMSWDDVMVSVPLGR